MQGGKQAQPCFLFLILEQFGHVQGTEFVTAVSHYEYVDAMNCGLVSPAVTLTLRPGQPAGASGQANAQPSLNRLYADCATTPEELQDKQANKMVLLFRGRTMPEFLGKKILDTPWSVFIFGKNKKSFFF